MSAIPAILLINEIQRGDPFNFGVGGGGGGGHRPRKPKKSINWYAAIVYSAIFALLTWFVVFIVRETREDHRLDGITPVVYTIPMGYVRRIGECSAGKHYYNCWVYMSTGKYWRTDVTKWPSGFIDPSTTLHWEIWTQEYRQTQHICNATKCVEQNRYEKGDDGYSETFAKGN